MLLNIPGTYALLMRMPVAKWLQIGKFGKFHFQSGWYLYVGSAKGIGGVKARTDRHLARHRDDSKPLKWHIDYLREAVEIKEIWFSYDERSLEHKWSQAIAKLFRAEIPAPGFGSSDCKAKCHAHLFRLAKRPGAAALCSAFNPSKKLIHLEFVSSSHGKQSKIEYLAQKSASTAPYWMKKKFGRK